MKTIQGISLAAALVLLLSGCFIDIDDDAPFRCVFGEGSVITDSLNLNNFDGIILDIPAEVDIRIGAEQRVVVEGKPNILSELEWDVRNGVWEIEFDRCVRDMGTLKIFITLPNLRSVKNRGSGIIRSSEELSLGDLDLEVNGSGDIELQLQADDLRIINTGSGDLLLSGTADELNARLSGSGDLFGFPLPVREADVTITGSGDAEVRVADLLRARLSGSGDLRYKGQPTIDVIQSGSGRLVDAN